MKVHNNQQLIPWSSDNKICLLLSEKDNVVSRSITILTFLKNKSTGNKNLPKQHPNTYAAPNNTYAAPQYNQWNA